MNCSAVSSARRRQKSAIVGWVVAAGLLGAALASVARAEPAFAPAATEACVSAAAAAAPSLSGYTVLDCAGRSAQACMALPGGDSTMGMITCLEGELRYWDRRLNAAYAKRMAAAKAADAEPKIRGAAPSLGESLRGMQRSWISYRDAACRYEQAQWLGGSGAGPATIACQMTETARQALRLEGWWSQ